MTDDPQRTDTTEPPAETLVTEPPASTANRVPHTRTGAAWFGICAAALISVVLIVFMAQNNSVGS